MKVLMSIKPKYADKIFSGAKRWEFRKKIWKYDNRKNIDTIVAYASSPIKAVIGEFNIGVTTSCDKAAAWHIAYPFAGISPKEYMKYFEEHNYIYMLEVIKPTLYGTPRPLSDYGISRPPQNFMYLED